MSGNAATRRAPAAPGPGALVTVEQAAQVLGVSEAEIVERAEKPRRGVLLRGWRVGDGRYVALLDAECERLNESEGFARWRVVALGPEPAPDAIAAAIDKATKFARAERKADPEPAKAKPKRTRVRPAVAPREF